MRIKYYIDLVRGRTAALNPASFNLKHIWAYLQSQLRAIFPTPKYIKEQIVWRRLQVMEKSPECWKQGQCIQCGCDMVGKTMADMGCENEPFCYPEMMKKKKWIEFKMHNEIKIFEEC